MGPWDVAVRFLDLLPALIPAALISLDRLPARDAPRLGQDLCPLPELGMSLTLPLYLVVVRVCDLPSSELDNKLADMIR